MVPLRVSTILIFLTLCQSSNCAEVTVREDFLGNPLVFIEGTIQEGDFEKVKMKAAEAIVTAADRKKEFKPGTGTLTLQLNTNGGDIVEAIKIGRFARENLASVRVLGSIIYSPDSDDADVVRRMRLENPERALENESYKLIEADRELSDDDITSCYSAGILIFYGCVKRLIRDNSDQRRGSRVSADIPVIGLHRPYYSQEFFSKLSPAEASKSYKELEKLVREYLTEMGAPQSLSDRMFRKASNEIELVGSKEFRKLFQDEEPFVEEWLLSKCGASTTSIPEGERLVLDEKEFSEFNEIALKRSRALGNGEIGIGDDYVPEGFSSERVEYLYRKVRRYNYQVNNCKDKAILEHQYTWAEEYIREHN